MTLTERINELVDEAEKQGLSLDGLEAWQPMNLLLSVGTLLGLSRAEILEPVTEL